MLQNIILKCTLKLKERQILITIGIILKDNTEIFVFYIEISMHIVSAYLKNTYRMIIFETLSETCVR